MLQIQHLQEYREMEQRMLHIGQGPSVCDATMLPIAAVLARPIKKLQCIRKTARIAAFLFFIFYFLLTGQAQTFTTSISAATIGKNQFAEVSYEMANAGTIDNFQAPKFKDWLVVSGPNNSSYQSNINGQMSQRTTISYYLQPKKTGQLLVEGATVLLDGKPMTSKPKVVQVLDKEVADQQPGTDPVDPFGNLLNDPFFVQPPVVQVVPKADEFAEAMMLRPGENAPEKIKNNLFIKVITDKNSCYEGEPITATYKVFTRLDINASVTKRPSFSGFSAYDLEEPNQPYIIEEIGGKKYKSWVLRKVQLYPLQSGKLTLEPVEVDCSIRFVKGEMVANRTYDPYSDNSFTTVQYVLKSPAISINAMPLPQDSKPKNFGGAVGSFSIAATTDDARPGKDDAIRLRVHITGSGNFSMVQAPAIQWPAKTEAYEPTESENLVKSVMPISGDKTFEYAFVPHQAGPYTVPAVNFSYFDVAAKTYKTVSTQPVTFNVSEQSKRRNPLAGEEEHNWPVVFSQIAGYALPILAGGLLLFLLISFAGRKKKKQHATEKQAMHNAWERMMSETPAPPATATIPIISAPPVNTPQPVQPLHNSYMPATLADEPVVTAQQDEPDSVKITDVPMMESETLIWQDDHRLFYKVLKTDILKQLSIRVGIMADNKIKLLDALKLKGIDSNILQQISSLYDECDAALYSPMSSTANRHKTLEEAKFLLGELG